MNSLFNNYENNTVFKIFLVLLAFFIFYHIAGFLLPIILAIALAFALQPLANLFAQVKIGPARKQISRDFAIILAFVTVAAFMYIVAKLMVLPLFGEVNQFLHELPEYLKRFNSSNPDWLTLGLIQLAVASVLAFAAMPLAGEHHIPDFSWPLLSIALGLGLASAVIQYVMNWAQRSVNPSQAAIIYAGEPVWAALFGRLAGERLAPLALLGGLLVVFGIMISEWKPKLLKSKKNVEQL